MLKEGFSYFEDFTRYYTRGFQIEKILFDGETAFQEVHIFTNHLFGKMLFLDRKIQSAGMDEYVYHESLVHPVMITHPEPKRVLILGGGEGATLREVLKHGCVENLTMVDIDGELVDICRAHLPEWSAGAFEHPKTHLLIGDAEDYVKGTGETFDIVISDLTEPLEDGPSIRLFTLEFFQKVFDILNDDGFFVLQAGSTDTLTHQFFTSCAATLAKVFPVVRPYWTFVFSFGLPWGFVMASKKNDPLKQSVTEVKKVMEHRRIEGLKFYRPALRRGFFALPFYLEDSFKKASVLTEKNPFIWTA